MDKQSKEMQELDVWLATEVMGWKPHPRIPGWWNTKPANASPVGAYRNDWHPTTNIAQAFEVLDKFDDWILEKDEGKYGCCVWDNKCHRHSVAGQAIPALAICLACRKAMEAK